ncbi:unnamed protein product [Pleuronectes platessa]|uniref:SRCR domain-containing protein n=1 Tax=Pleuronectes platessa TaxID=8262 RepID=A0A9N7VQZ2_PLEPL|nr:unnamed protein product [Pleuronectes platessa]
MDCISNNGVDCCADPCERYTELHHDWRSTDNTMNLNPRCDRDVNWQGWYRLFLNQTSAHVPESSHTINVKLCNGNYYVYKLVKPNGCCLAYCAVQPGPPVDNSTGVEGQVRLANGGNSSCSGRVEIFLRGQWGTVCDDHWDLVDDQVVCRKLGCGRVLSAPQSARFGQGSAPIWLDNVICSGREQTADFQGSGSTAVDIMKMQALSVNVVQRPPPQHPQLICGRDEIQIGLNMAAITAMGLNPLSGNLAVRNCSWVRMHNDVVWYEVDAQAGACGNTLRTNRTHAIYSNSLYLYRGKVSFSRPVILPFSCAYPLDTEASMNVAIRQVLPILGHHNNKAAVGLSGLGSKARASMSLFRTSSFTQPYPSGLITLPVGSPLHVGVSVLVRDPSFVVVLENCYASDSSNPNDIAQYFFIQNKKTVEVIESSSSRQACFSALFVLIHGEYSDINLHCSLCDQRSSRCSPKKDISLCFQLCSSEAPHHWTLTWDKSLE